MIINFRNVKQYYDRIQITNKEIFNNKLSTAMDGMVVADLTVRRSKAANLTIALLVAILPLAGFTAYQIYVKWNGTKFISGQNIAGPGSQWANPYYEKFALNVPDVKVYNLADSRRIAKFPIHEPINIPGWKLVLSEGITSNAYGYKGMLQGPAKLVSVTKTPLMYLDVYTNHFGQRIAVTQQYDEMISISLKQYKGIKQRYHVVDPVNEVGNNSIQLTGYPDSTAYLETGRWSEIFTNDPLITDKPAFRGGFENVIVFHQNKNDTVTEVIVDEYGKVPAPVLESIAHRYLVESIKR